MHTILLEGVGIVIIRNPCAASIVSTNSIMIIPLSSVTVSAISQNPMYGNVAHGVPVISPYIEELIWPKLTSPINLNVDRSC